MKMSGKRAIKNERMGEKKERDNWSKERVRMEKRKRKIIGEKKEKDNWSKERERI
jgi:hypothetical protein